MRMRRKTRTKRIGSNALCLAAVIAVVGSALPALSGEKSRKPPASTALVAGTVFRESGLSFPGAELTLEAVPDSGKRSKGRSWKAVSDSRGEFAFRVPAGPARYTLTVSAPAMEPWKSQIEIQGEERVDLSIVLKPKGGSQKPFSEGKMQ